MPSDRVVVVGASGFGRESLDVLEAMQGAGNSLEIVGVVDDAPSPANLSRLSSRGIPYLGSIDAWLASAPSDAKYILGIGNPTVRRKIVGNLHTQGLRAARAIHPSAILGSSVTLGEGVVVCAGAVISTNVVLGDHVHINPNATIGHDSQLAQFVSVNPAAVISGDVTIDEAALIGAGAVVLQGLRVGSSALIGSSACVTRDVPPGIVVKGVPARA